MTAGPRAAPSLSPHSTPPALLQTRTWKDVCLAKQPGALRTPMASSPCAPAPAPEPHHSRSRRPEGAHARRAPRPCEGPPFLQPTQPQGLPGPREGGRRETPQFHPETQKATADTVLTRADLLELRARGEARGGGAKGSEPHSWHRKDPEVRAMPDAPQPPQTQESPPPAGQVSSVRGRICFRFRRDRPWALRRGAWLPTGHPGLRRK